MVTGTHLDQTSKCVFNGPFCTNKCRIGVRALGRSPGSPAPNVASLLHQVSGQHVVKREWIMGPREGSSGGCDGQQRFISI